MVTKEQKSKISNQNDNQYQFELEFQAVLLAAGRGSRINQLLNGKPKCLLPVANKPMIQYSLELLVRHHIPEVLIIVLDNEEEQIKTSISRMGLDIKLEYSTIPHSDDYATADSLRSIKDKLKKDILLLSSDLITDIDLKPLFQMFRMKNATFSCLFSSIKSEKENIVPANKLDNNKEFDYIGLDAEDPNRLVFFEPDVMFDDVIPLKRSLLRWCPSFILNTNLTDSHVYMFRNWILDYLEYKADIGSVKMDLLPSLVRKQFRIVQKDKNNSVDIDQPVQSSKNWSDFVDLSEMEKHLAEIELRDPYQDRYPQSTILCSALVINSGYCIRANNLIGFCDANRLLMKKQQQQQSSKDFPDCLIGQGLQTEDRCTIKRTVIGNNCQIKSNVQIHNCILQNNVIIENGCNLINCLICNDVQIGSESHLENCIIGPKQKVPCKSRSKNESIMEEIMDF